MNGLTRLLNKYHSVTFWCNQSNKNYATPKSRTDVKLILENIGVTLVGLQGNQQNKVYEKLYLEKSKADSKGKPLVTILQYPLKPLFNVFDEDSIKPTIDTFEAITKISDKTIVFVHDIKTIQSKLFRKKVNKKLQQVIQELETAFLTQADALVVHSDAMANYVFSEFGVPKHNFTSLGIFDYLGAEVHVSASNQEKKVIGFAGYLGLSKRDLVEKLFKELPSSAEVSFNLYGPDFVPVSGDLARPDITYKGSIPPEIIPRVFHTENNYGLVWDSLDELQRAYYEMISPHKCSLYLRAGVPLIVPAGTCAGEFVERLKLGFVIEDLFEIREINEPGLVVDLDAIEKLRQQVGSGHFTKKALEDTLRKFKDENEIQPKTLLKEKYSIY